MTVSFVIPNWNRRELLRAALASVRRQSVAPGEVLVVDNGSTDGSAEAAREEGAAVLALGENRGFSAAVNRGIAAAGGEAVAVLNNDVELEPDWTARLLEGLERSGCWFGIGKLLDYVRRDRVDGVGDALCRGAAACRLGHGKADGAWSAQSRLTSFPCATAVLARREFFARTGPFEEAFFAYLEDVELGLRAALLGLEGIYVPEAVAYHHGSATLGRWSAPMVRWMTRNQILLAAKYYPGPLLRRYWRAIAAAQGLWAALAWRHGRGWSWARGLGAGLRGMRGIRRAGARWRSDGKELATILTRSERELASFERSAGWDTYWRWYFRLAAEAGGPQP